MGEKAAELPEADPPDEVPKGNGNGDTGGGDPASASAAADPERPGCSEAGGGSSAAATPTTATAPAEVAIDCETAEEHPEDGPSYSLARENAKALAAGVLTLAIVAATLVLLFREESRHAPPECGSGGGCVMQPDVCETCGTDTDRMWVLPLFGEWEQTWPKSLRAVLYFVGLFWCFLGVNMVCDLFMASIEEITSARRVMWVVGVGGIRQKFHVKVWNDTLANLTLMALGSSAPEIMVSMMEMGGRSWFTGDLGPSTIVGSAAFNLLLITAACIVAIPAPEIRLIKQLDVFIVTAVISVCAYFWLVIALKVITPDKIDLWEALVTLGMFPVLLAASFATDRGCFRRSEPEGVSSKQVEELQTSISETYGKSISEDTIKMMILERSGPASATGPSRAAYRQGITRLIAGDRSQMSRVNEHAKDNNTSTIGFKNPKHVVLECAGKYELPVCLNRPLPWQLEISYATSDGQAKDGVRYNAVSGTLCFDPCELEKVIEIPIIDNDTWEPPENFFVDLFDLQVKGDEEELPQKATSRFSLPMRKANSMTSNTPTIASSPAGTNWRSSASNRSGLSSALSARSSIVRTSIRSSVSRTSIATLRSVGFTPPKLATSRATVLILNDDEPGTLSFMTEEVSVRRDACSTVTLTVNRTKGSCGSIAFSYTTRDGSAIQGFDYELTQGTVEMADGEDQASIPITIMPQGAHPEDRHFFVHVTSSCEGVYFDPETNGGSDSAICDVSIVGSPTMCHQLRRWSALTFNKRRFLLGLSLWREQLVAALYCNSSPEDQQGASLFDWIFHCVSLIWKALFALMPPTVFCGGWCCFFFALMVIGLVTVVIIDLANLLGCVLGIPNEVTAITLVALGTSLPDMFASRLAAQNDEYADNAIGNVTGSNSVNVFLGLGLPWVVGAFHWQSEGTTDSWLSWCHDGRTYAELYGDMYPSGGLIIPARRLFYSVGIFTCCALVCVVLLLVRRQYCGGELGGTRSTQLAHSAILVFLWLAYIGASIVVSVMVPS